VPAVLNKNFQLILRI